MGRADQSAAGDQFFFGPNPNPMQTWIQPCWKSQSFRRSKILHDYNLVNPIMNYPQYRGLWHWVYLYDWVDLWHWAYHITNIGYLIIFIFIQYLFWLLGHVQTPPQAHKIHKQYVHHIYKTPNISCIHNLLHSTSWHLGRKRCPERCSESRAPSENHESHQRYLLSKGCIIPTFWKCPEMSGHACPIKKNMIPMMPIQTVGARSDFMRPTISVVPVTHDLRSLVEMDDILLKATWHSEEAGGQRTRFQTYFYWGMRHDTLTCWFNKI